jgi:hypothetical protein
MRPVKTVGQESSMDIVGGAKRVITRTADATTAAAGAVGGAAVIGVIGGVQGTFSGIRNGISSGSHSTPAAAMTLGVLGAAGLVEWPVLLTVGGTALVIHHLSRRSNGQPTHASVRPLKAASGNSAAQTPARRRAAPQKSTGQGTRARKASTPRRRTSTRSS